MSQRILRLSQLATEKGRSGLAATHPLPVTHMTPEEIQHHAQAMKDGRYLWACIREGNKEGFEAYHRFTRELDGDLAAYKSLIFAAFLAIKEAQALPTPPLSPEATAQLNKLARLTTNTIAATQRHGAPNHWNATLPLCQYRECRAVVESCQRKRTLRLTPNQRHDLAQVPMKLARSFCMLLAQAMPTIIKHAQATTGGGEDLNSAMQATLNACNTIANQMIYPAMGAAPATTTATGRSADPTAILNTCKTALTGFRCAFHYLAMISALYAPGANPLATLEAGAL